MFWGVEMDDLRLNEFRCLEAIRDAQMGFYQEVLEYALEYRKKNPIEHPVNTSAKKIIVPEDELSEEEVRHLSLDGVEQIAEFFYCMETMGLNSDPRRLRAYLERHNALLRSMITDIRSGKKSSVRRQLSVSRLEEGILDPHQIDAMVEEAEDQGLRYDQSSLGALLIQAMSMESSRNLIKLLHRCGLIRRKGKSTVNIRSNGVLENAYRTHLRMILSRLEAVHGTA